LSTPILALASNTEWREDDMISIGPAIGAGLVTTNLHHAIVLQIAELTRKLQEQPPVDDIGKPLSKLVDVAAKSVPGAEHAAITVVGCDGVRTVAATARYPLVGDRFRQHHNGGPCAPETWDHEVIRIDDVTTERRWPAYCRDIADTSPIRSVLAYRLFSDRHSIGLLSFYSERPHAFDSDSIEVGLIMATHTALAWNMLRRDQQFRSALASRDLIGQAKGMIMERFRIDAVQAFELLSRLSQNSNTPVAEVARELVEAEFPPA
jgi:GAF domain-containing protein